MNRHFLLAAGVLVLTLLSLFVFPGRTILQSDTQIYIPILERMNNPALFEKDIMAVRPHVAFTVYDEVALLLKKVTGLEFETILRAQQALYRAMGIAGLLLLAMSFGLAPGPAFLVTALASLGATISGPAVLTVEYEPVPRGFSMPFILLSLGLAGFERWRLAGVAAAVAFLFHPPTALPLLGLMLALALWRREWACAAIVTGGAALMAVFVGMQAGSAEHMPLFSRISPELERLQRMRASYNWISVWIGRWWLHYTLFTVAGVISFWRVRRLIPGPLQFLLAGFSLCGVLGVAASWVLLEQQKWSLIPQLQPGRYLEFVVLFAVLLAATAGVAESRRPIGIFIAALFFVVLVVAAIPANLSQPLLPALAAWKRIVILVCLPAALALVSWRRRGWMFALAAIVPFLLLPGLGKVRNYPDMHSPELNQLAGWARTKTNIDDVFLFPTAGQRPQPSIFRARSLRALYVDWKGGGQLNFLPMFAEEWWRRWQSMEIPREPWQYAQFGIDYVVYPAAQKRADLTAVYENGAWVVYATR